MVTNASVETVHAVNPNLFEQSYGWFMGITISIMIIIWLVVFRHPSEK